MDSAKEDRIRAGLWEATPGTTRSIKGETWECCIVLSRVADICEVGGRTIRVRAGDTFVLKPGFVGVWRTLETLRKIWVIVD